MNRTSAYRPYSAQVTTETRMPILTKTTKTEKPLDVLYIQAMDVEHNKQKKHTRETLIEFSREEGINSGEIAVKDLEGNDEEEKMRSLTSLLNRLRYEGKLNDSTQVILSFKPGEDPNTLDISHRNFSGSWNAEAVLEAVTGKSNSEDEKASDKFNGTIHLFGFEPQEFKNEDSPKNNLQKYGNILVHTSGKLNWDYRHDHMIKQIVSSVKSVEGSDPEQRTKSMRDMIQPFAGYPIIRVSAERITIKYATFSDDLNIKTYKNRIRNHKNPFDMMINSLERDSLETFKKRMEGGLKFRYPSDLGKNKNLDKLRNSRLLTALVLTSKDQKEKLAYLKSEGVITDRMQFSKTGSLNAAISKRLVKMDLELLEMVSEKPSNPKIRPINKENILPFLKSRITADRDMSEALDKSLELIGKNLKKLSGEDTKELIAYVFEIYEKSDGIINILEKLLKKGLNIKDLNESHRSELINLVSLSYKYHDVSLLDFFHQKLFDPSKYLKDEVLISYKLFSKESYNWTEIKDQLIQKINENDKSFFMMSLVGLTLDEMSKGKFSATRLLEFLLNCGLNPDWKDGDNNSLLLSLCLMKKINVDSIIYLLKKGAKNYVEINDHEVSFISAIAANPYIEDKETLKAIDELIDKEIVDIGAVSEEEDLLFGAAAHLGKPKLLESLFAWRTEKIGRRMATNILSQMISGAVNKTDEGNFDLNSQKKFSETLKVLLSRYRKDDIFMDSKLEKEFRKIAAFKGQSLIEFKNSISKTVSHMLV